MSDRVYFSLAGVAAVLILALALVWPQGLGARSPPPFRQPLGPVDPEVTALARAQRKPVRPRFERPRPAGPAGPGETARGSTSPRPAPALRGPAADVPLPGGRP